MVYIFSHHQKMRLFVFLNRFIFSVGQTRAKYSVWLSWKSFVHLDNSWPEMCLWFLPSDKVNVNFKKTFSREFLLCLRLSSTGCVACLCLHDKNDCESPSHIDVLRAAWFLLDCHLKSGYYHFIHPETAVKCASFFRLVSKNIYWYFFQVCFLADIGCTIVLFSL